MKRMLKPFLLACAGASALLPSAMAALPTLDFQNMASVTRYPDNHSAMAQGPDGSVYVVSDDYSAGFIMKWSADGALAWNSDILPTSGADWTTGAAVDGEGNVYVPVTDYSNSRALLFKYTAQGERAAYVEEPNIGGDYAPMSGGVVFDRERGLLYAAQVYMDPSDWKYYAAVFVYDSALQLQGSRRISLGDSGDIGANVSLDAAGNVYLGTYLKDAEYTPRYVAAKYSPGLAGELWLSTVEIGDYYGRNFYLFNQGPPSGGLAFWSTSQAGSALRRVSADGAFGAAMDVPRGGWGVMTIDADGAVYLKRQSEDYSRTGLVKINAASEYLWGDALLTESEANSMTQALAGAGNKLYTTGITCGETDCGVYLARYSQGDGGDTTAPGAVTDLRVTQVSSYSATLAWTAPGDDGADGSAASYDLRYTVGVAIDSENAFESAVKAAGLPTPAVAGSAGKFVLTGLSAGGTYYFALKAADEAGNISALSNSPKGVTSTAHKYKISVSTFGWQIVAISTWSAPMEGLVTILGTTLSATGLRVDFSISTSPAGATGQELSKSSETTSAKGLADVLLKLGDIPAEYGVTATCRDCDASASTVTFTCCGKLPNDSFSQGDPIWSTHTYANSSQTIQQRGCALTSLATLNNYYQVAVSTEIPVTNPGTLNTYLRDNSGYDVNNSVSWTRIREFSRGHIRCVAARDINSTTTQEDLRREADREILNRRPVIFRVRHLTPSGYSTHFVLGIGKCGDRYLVSDPGDRNRTLFDPDDGTFYLQGIRVFQAR